MPSNTARSAGTIYPVVKSIPPCAGRRLRSAAAIGGYLCWTAFATTSVTSCMFATALAPNLFAAELAGKIAGVQVGWMTWMTGALPLGILLFVLTAVSYVLYPPTIGGVEVVTWAPTSWSRWARSPAEVMMALLAIAAAAGGFSAVRSWRRSSCLSS